MTKTKILKKTILITIILVIVYIVLSLLMNRGKFTAVHYFSYDTKEMYREKVALISDRLNMKIEGDSLRSIENLDKKFFLGKSIYQEFYGFLIHSVKENPQYRRLHWDEPIENARGRNWIVMKDAKYVGEAFISGWYDAKIGDTVLLEIRNKKHHNLIGTLEILIE